MPLIIPGKSQIDFFLRTTKPFHNERAVKDFFRIVLSYGLDYRPVKYGRSEPMKELFDEKHLEKVASAWLGGNDCTSEILESQYCLSQLMMKGRPSSKVTYFVSWRNWTDRILFNVIQTTIAKKSLKKDRQEMDRYVSLCNDLVCRFPQSVRKSTILPAPSHAPQRKACLSRMICLSDALSSSGVPISDCRILTF